MFSDDKPIRHQKDDRLGRTPFASALAKAIRLWKGRESCDCSLRQVGVGKVLDQEHREGGTRVKTQLAMLRFNGLVNRIGGPTDAGELVLV
jgi:hypothetical protein